MAQSCCRVHDTQLSDVEFSLVCAAFKSMDVGDSGSVALTNILQRINSMEHPRVKDCTMAPSAVLDRVRHQFEQCSREHEGVVRFDEFVAFHEKLVDEAFTEKHVDVDSYIIDVITRLWRLGDLLIPTGIRPVFPITEMPTRLYGSTHMSLIWPEPNTDISKPISLKGFRDVVRPIFARGDLPVEVQGFFAFPAELTGLNVEFLPTRVILQNWLDFVWEYGSGEYCSVPGIISSRIDVEKMPAYLKKCVTDHSKALQLNVELVPTHISTNTMYKRSSEAYGAHVKDECTKISAWKARSLAGKQRGLQYYGLTKNTFSQTQGPTQTDTGTRMNY